MYIPLMNRWHLQLLPLKWELISYQKTLNTVAKYNQLLRIEEELGAAAVYPGMGAFNVRK